MTRHIHAVTINTVAVVQFRFGEENTAKGSLQSQHDTDQCMYVNKSLKSRGKGITWKEEKE